jgi:DNA-binding NarL/FixJ family response regulator
MKRPRVLLADDHRLLREVFMRLLAGDCDIVGAVADGRALLAAAAELRPDVVVLDIAMPVLNGLEAARRLKQDMPEVKVIFLTMSEDADVAAEAFRVGASGYLLKNSAVSELHQAIREVALGRSYVTPLAARCLAGAPAHAARPLHANGELSARQVDVLRLLAEGLTMKRIARALNIKPRTVAYHKYTMMEELRPSSPLPSRLSLLPVAFRDSGRLFFL